MQNFIISSSVTSMLKINVVGQDIWLLLVLVYITKTHMFQERAIVVMRTLTTAPFQES